MLLPEFEPALEEFLEIVLGTFGMISWNITTTNEIKVKVKIQQNLLQISDVILCYKTTFNKFYYEMKIL